jgi:GGDEF domain-containing protein
MPGARAIDARRRVEELLALANATLAATGEGARSLELSVGAAEFSGGENLDAAVRHADAAMYEEKARRRRIRLAAVGAS